MAIVFLGRAVNIYFVCSSNSVVDSGTSDQKTDVRFLPAALNI